jgi:hypothetical protein
MDDRFDSAYHSQHHNPQELVTYNLSHNHNPQPYYVSANTNRRLVSQVTQEPQEPVVVHDHDVLAGRGVNIAQHPGNQRFRTLISTYKDKAYCTTYTAQEKRAVAKEIIGHIITLDPPGRFLRREGRGHISRGLSGPWEVLNEKDCIKKTCQALRDCNRLDRSGYAEGVSRPEDVQVVASVVEHSGKSVKQRAKDAATSLGNSTSISDLAALGAETSSTSSDSVYKRRREDVHRHPREPPASHAHSSYPAPVRDPGYSTAHPGMSQAHVSSYYNNSPTHSAHSHHNNGHSQASYLGPGPPHAHAHYHVHYHPPHYQNYERQMASMQHRHSDPYHFSSGGTFPQIMANSNSNNGHMGGHLGPYPGQQQYQGYHSSENLSPDSYPAIKKQRTMDSDPSTASSSSTQVIEPPSTSYQNHGFPTFPAVPEGEETDVSLFHIKDEHGGMDHVWPGTQPDPPSILQQEYDEYGLDNID